MALIGSGRRKNPHITIDIDARDYIDIDSAIDEADAEWLFDECDAARRNLTKLEPDVQEALLRLERMLPLLRKAAGRK